MKKIICKVVAVEPNIEDYGEAFFDNLFMPCIGGNVIIEREDYYPFKVGGKDGESIVPRGVLPIDKNGAPCERFLYYVRFEQISII